MTIAPTNTRMRLITVCVGLIHVTAFAQDVRNPQQLPEPEVYTVPQEDTGEFEGWLGEGTVLVYRGPNAPDPEPSDSEEGGADPLAEPTKEPGPEETAGTPGPDGGEIPGEDGPFGPVGAGGPDGEGAGNGAGAEGEGNVAGGTGHVESGEHGTTPAGNAGGPGNNGDIGVESGIPMSAPPSGSGNAVHHPMHSLHAGLIAAPVLASFPPGSPATENPNQSVPPPVTPGYHPGSRNVMHIPVFAQPQLPEVRNPVVIDFDRIGREFQERLRKHVASVEASKAGWARGFAELSAYDLERRAGWAETWSELIRVDNETHARARAADPFLNAPFGDTNSSNRLYGDFVGQADLFEWYDPQNVSDQLNVTPIDRIDWHDALYTTSAGWQWGANASTGEWIPHTPTASDLALAYSRFPVGKEGVSEDNLVVVDIGGGYFDLYEDRLIVYQVGDRFVTDGQREITHLGVFDANRGRLGKVYRDRPLEGTYVGAEDIITVGFGTMPKLAATVGRRGSVALIGRFRTGLAHLRGYRFSSQAKLDAARRLRKFNPLEYADETTRRGQAQRRLAANQSKGRMLEEAGEELTGVPRVEQAFETAAGKKLKTDFFDEEARIVGQAKDIVSRWSRNQTSQIEETVYWAERLSAKGGERWTAFLLVEARTKVPPAIMSLVYQGRLTLLRL